MMRWCSLREMGVCAELAPVQVLRARGLIYMDVISLPPLRLSRKRMHNAISRAEHTSESFRSGLFPPDPIRWVLMASVSGLTPKLDFEANTALQHLG